MGLPFHARNVSLSSLLMSFPFQITPRRSSRLPFADRSSLLGYKSWSCPTSRGISADMPCPCSSFPAKYTPRLPVLATFTISSACRIGDTRSSGLSWLLTQSTHKKRRLGTMNPSICGQMAKVASTGRSSLPQSVVGLSGETYPDLLATAASGQPVP